MWKKIQISWYTYQIKLKSRAEGIHRVHITENQKVNLDQEIVKVREQFNFSFLHNQQSIFPSNSQNIHILSNDFWLNQPEWEQKKSKQH